MRVIFLVALLTSMANPVAHAFPVLPVIHDLSDAVSTKVQSQPESQGAALAGSPIGDTYSGATLVQGSTVRYMRNSGVTTHTFDGSPEAAGGNLYGAPGDTFVVNESATLSGDILTVRTRWTNINSGGDPAPWVAAGVVDPDGNIVTSVRLDVGVSSGGANRIDVPGFGYISGTGIARGLNSAGSQIASGALLAPPPGGSSAIRGQAAIGAGGGDVAGLDLATIEFEWQLEPLPSITSVTPDSGPDFGGTDVTITGENFDTDATASFGGVACTGIVVTVPDTITCSTPPGSAGSVDVTVTNPGGGTGTLVGGYEYIAAPSVTSILPGSGAAVGGTAVTVTGSDFQTGATVSFGGAACTGAVVTVPDTITCTTPAGTPGLVDVIVTNPDSRSGTLANGFEYVAAPSIASINPNTGPAVGGTAVTISGSDFQNGASASFGGAACSGAVVTVPDTISCTTPAGTPGLVDVIVTNPDGQSATLADSFEYVAAPSIASINPNTGPSVGGTAVTVSGSDFQAGASASFGGAACTGAVVTVPDTITCTTPAGTPGLVDVIVTNPDGQLATMAGGYEYVAAPVLASVTPDSGPAVGGTGVTISGSDFQAGASASFGGAACTGAVVSVPDTITCTTPAGTPGLVDVIVTNPDGQSATLADGYEYIAAPSIGAISPEVDVIFGGTTVIITGDDFQVGAQVFFNGTACNDVVVDPPNSISCTVPMGAAVGAVDVTVENPDGQSDTLALGFTYLAPIPVPTLGALTLVLLSLLMLGMGVVAARDAVRAG